MSKPFPSLLVIQAYRLAIAIDQVGNVLIGGRPRETISGTVGRAMLRGERWALRVAGPFIDSLFGTDHCAKQAVVEKRRRALRMGDF